MAFVAQLVKNPSAMRKTPVQSLGLGRSPGESERLPTPVFWPGESHERPAVAICAPELLGRLPFWGMSPGPWPVVLRGQEPKVALSPTAKLA